MVPGGALSPMLVVASHTGHESLRVVVLHVWHELVSGGAPERCGSSAVVADHHVVADQRVLESAWSVGHGPSMPVVAPERRPTLEGWAGQSLPFADLSCRGSSFGTERIEVGDT